VGVFAGPDLSENGLVLALDAANPKNYNLTAVEVLVVAGGGAGGGYGGNDGSGGGGAGGLIYNSNFAVTQGTQLTVNVGAGGAGAAAQGNRGFNGANSEFGALIAIGGGGGGSEGAAEQRPGASGGSGGGGGGYGVSSGPGGNGTAGQGNRGGDCTAPGDGGGGGAGAAGQSGLTGIGGIGLVHSISGTTTYYAGGGGASGDKRNTRGGGGALGGLGGGGKGQDATNSTPPENGTNATGGGGGAAAGSTPTFGAGTTLTSGAGGSGIVIVRYPGPQKAIGGTVTSNNGYTIHTFITSGTFTPLVATNNSAILGIPDFSGGNNFATAVSGPTYSSGHEGSLSFDSTDDYISSPSSSLFAFGTGDFTLQVWIFPQSFSTYTHMIALPSQSTFALKANVSDGQIYFYSPTFDTYGFTSGWTLSLNTWNFVVFKRESSVGYAFLNGVSRGSKSGFTSNFSAQVLNIHNGYAGEFAQCKIAQVQIYNRALSAAEISQNFNATRGRFGI
jgi:hypothetical protein